jgi:hypothetical protein
MKILLPLWKYAADNQIPIMTHCIGGTIFYRGRKKDEWNEHPVFQQSIGEQRYEPLLLDAMQNEKIYFELYASIELTSVCWKKNIA